MNVEFVAGQELQMGFAIAKAMLMMNAEFVAGQELTLQKGFAIATAMFTMNAEFVADQEYRRVIAVVTGHTL